MCGFDQRYQNGFDCQGLWVEVEVERALGLADKRAIEAMGLEAFARACRERVLRFAAIQTEQSRRLGQWMDWPRSYFTMSDTNVAHIGTSSGAATSAAGSCAATGSCRGARGAAPRSRSTRCWSPTWS